MHQTHKRHMFSITDRIHKVYMSVEWCPTGEITGDFLTKPNQGSIFKRFRDLIMGVIPQTDPRNGKQGNINKKQTKKSNK